MTIALRRVRDRIRGRLRDGDGKHPTYVTPQYDEAIAAAYLQLQARLPAATLYTASAFTISAGADTFTLPTSVTQWTGGDGGAEYAGDVRIQLVSTGNYLRRMEGSEMDSWRAGSPSVVPAIPERFSIWEDKTQIIQGRVWPGAKDAQLCNLWVTMSADDLRDFVGSGSDDLDDVEVQFSRIAAQALELYTAADLVMRMVPEDLALRRLNPQIAPLWMKEADRMLYREAARRNALEDIGRVSRRVS